jgi:hypothetical protein
MWVILCDAGDRAAAWAYSRLRRRGLDQLELITSHDLAGATYSVHEIDSYGARFEIQLSDGRTVVSADVRGVLNRLSFLPAESLAVAAPADRNYAFAEMSALITSWLTCISPVTLNKPTAYGWSGAGRPAVAWRQLAAAAGMPVLPQTFSSHDVGSAFAPDRTASMLILGEDVFGNENFDAAVSEGLVRGSAELARLAGADLLGVTLELHSRKGPQFASATTLPDLRAGGEAFIEALHTSFTTMPVVAP